MRNHLLMSAALAAVLAGGAVELRAQQQAPEAPAQRQTDMPQTTAPADKAPSAAMPAAKAPGAASPGSITQQQTDETRANVVIGTRVENPEKERIGKIHDLVFDKQGGLKAAIVSVGGFLGIGDKLVAVPWSEIKINDEDKVATVSMNKEQLTAAPSFKTKEDIQSEQRAEAARQRSSQQSAPSPAGGAPRAPTQ